jgi:hypothetical protein
MPMLNRTSGAFPVIIAAKCPVITAASGSAFSIILNGIQGIILGTFLFLPLGDAA